MSCGNPVFCLISTLSIPAPDRTNSCLLLSTSVTRITVNHSLRLFDIWAGFHSTLGILLLVPLLILYCFSFSYSWALCYGIKKWQWDESSTTVTIQSQYLKICFVIDDTRDCWRMKSQILLFWKLLMPLTCHFSTLEIQGLQKMKHTTGKTLLLNAKGINRKLGNC